MDELVCAQCRGTLEERDIGGVLAEQCDQCHSLFFDMGDLARVLVEGDLGDDASESRANDELTCPRCQIPLGRIARGGEDLFWYRLCSACRGLWLDSAEVAQLERASVPSVEAETQKERASRVVEELERLLARIDTQRDQRFSRLEKLAEHLVEKGLWDDREARSIRSAIDAEVLIAREALGQSRLFEEARRLCIAGHITGARFEAIRQRVVLAEP